MRRLIWTDEAVTNLDAITTYIVEFSPLAAARFTQRLKAAAASLLALPDRGRSLDGGLRELVIVHPYLIRYRLQDDAVVILRIRHGARQLD